MRRQKQQSKRQPKPPVASTWYIVDAAMGCIRK